jgi:hypothetical protein
MIASGGGHDNLSRPFGVLDMQRRVNSSAGISGSFWPRRRGPVDHLPALVRNEVVG